MLMDRARFLRRFVLTLVILAGISASVFWATDVDDGLEPSDFDAIDSLGVGAACEERSSFDDELACVRAIQLSLRERVPDLGCVHEWGAIAHEPADFLRRAKGCCFDRSRFIEKALKRYGFDTRHIGLFRIAEGPWPSLLRPGTPSHSTSEVLTRRGWMVVDSNRDLIGVDASGEVHDIASLRERLRSSRGADIPGAKQDYMDGDFVFVYGLYSRHGGFYRPFVPLPDLDWAQLHHN
jgi:hypothetical protein